MLREQDTKDGGALAGRSEGFAPLLDAAMLLRLSDPHLVPDLLQFLESRLDLVCKQVNENEVELSLLGSYNREAERMTVDLLLRAWEAARDAPGSVELVD
jgi:hypothetical protein